VVPASGWCSLDLPLELFNRHFTVPSFHRKGFQ
jgi:hypothetical protein